MTGSHSEMQFTRQQEKKEAGEGWGGGADAFDSVRAKMRVTLMTEKEISHASTHKRLCAHMQNLE